MKIPTVELTHLVVRIARFTILRNVSLQVPPGKVVGLVGHNGAGKTTTLRSIMGLTHLVSGSIVLDGADVSHWSPSERARAGVGYMPEDRRLVTGLSVEDNILMPAWSLNMSDAAERLATIYDIVPELKPLSQRLAEQLSGGQQKLVALARSFMYGKRLLVLDEPFEGVAPALSDRLTEVIQAFSRQGLSVLVAESDSVRLETLAETVCTIERGEVLGQASVVPTQG